MPNPTATQGNPAAGVIPAARWRIHSISVLPDLQLAMTFRDGLTGIADFSAKEKSARPGAYAPLAITDCFSRVQIKMGPMVKKVISELNEA